MFAFPLLDAKVVVDEGAIFPWEIRRVAQMKAGRGITLKVAHGGFTGCSLNYKTALEHGLFCCLDAFQKENPLEAYPSLDYWMPYFHVAKSHADIYRKP